MQVLAGHNSPETAYRVDDYPFGFVLRCKKRYWLEYRKGFGFRFVSQTTNPKRPGEVWNKPKAGTYHALAVMYLNEEGHCTYSALSSWAEEAELDKFLAAFAPGIGVLEREVALYLRARARASKRITYKIHEASDPTPPQTNEQANQLIRGVIAQEYGKLKQGV